MTGLTISNRKRQLPGMSYPYGWIDDFFGGNWMPARRSVMEGMFKLDIEENEQAYIVTAELPGVSKDEIGLELSDGRLTISVHKEESSESEQKNMIHKERSVYTKTRSVYFPDARPEDISANHENGVLSVTVSKREKSPASQKINIA
ncbi:MAG: Hsp20/alpha crystallin family protein [Defluviitaleaceae bacterium]|nr:Hsp20/alpha crystallin family protein [Defluviitaleaceae bacterium]